MKTRRKFESPDNYYERTCVTYIEKALSQIDITTMPLAEIISYVRKHYPFGEKKGRPYKIWNRIIGKYEIALEAATTTK